jgi:DNA-binding CsgD family transcriptional regulator
MRAISYQWFPRAGRHDVVRVVLRGRRSESDRLDRLLADARAGESQALVVRGEPGVGKTALLDYLIERASGWRVARAAGVQWEMELPFAGLHQLCGPMLDRLELLPGPQRDALGTAFGLRGGDAPERFVIGLAVLGLISEVAEEQPLLCVIDDAQWLDRASAQALAFVARRLMADQVALVFAARTPGDEQELDGLPELVVGGLPDHDARALLDSALRAPLDERVRDQIVGETRGNPLALVELPRGLSPAELAGGFGLLGASPLSGRIEESFLRQLERLPAETRRLLLLAAAEPVGDPLLLWRAAARLDIGLKSAAPAQAARLLELGGRVRFRHPLLRSAVYDAATERERRSAHSALADATDPEVDPDRRAWHLAQAAPGRDEEVADELERSAGRARARGGVAAAAAFLARAAELTIDPFRRAERALAAAQAKHQAGAPGAALQLLVEVQAGPLEELQRARMDLLRAQISALSSGPEAAALLLEAARRLEPLDAGLARDTYLEAFAAALFAGPLASGGGLVEVAEAARAAPPPPEPASASDVLFSGLALLITDGYAAGAPTLKRAMVAFRHADISGEEGLRRLWLGCTPAMDLWDDENWYVLSTRCAELARDAGALAALPTALTSRVGILLYAGEFDAAASAIEEVEAVTEATGSQLAPYGALGLLAWQGDEARATELIDANLPDVVARGEGVALGLFAWTRAFLHNVAGRHEEAVAAAEQALDYPAPLLYARWVLIELIEAAVRSGRADRAAAALEQLSESTRASGTEWALGIEARSRALLSDGEDAESLFREAIELLARTRVRVEHARAHLYGEWLLGESRRADARERLRTAHEMLTAIGARALADRAAGGLTSAGETTRGVGAAASADLTAQEAQVARLARDGLSNPEIGARLFISPRTVEYHLRKVFGKLDIGSRTELARVLAGDSEDAPVGSSAAR